MIKCMEPEQNSQDGAVSEPVADNPVPGDESAPDVDESVDKSEDTETESEEVED